MAVDFDTSGFEPTKLGLEHSDYGRIPQGSFDPYEDAETVTGDVTDDRGRIRLSLVRYNFRYRKLRTEEGRQSIKNCYKRWVDCDEYLWFAVVNVETGERVKEFCVKCAKRGNDVYRWRLKKRLGWIDEIEPEAFFNCMDRDLRGAKTKMLFVSLTYDTKRCSRREAWENVGKEWNRWISAVRRKFGTVKTFRDFEAFKNGYPHIHAVLVFEDHEFEVSFRDKHKKFRILREEKDWFDGLWHSNVDVEACYSTGAFDYIKKYMLKEYGARGSEVEDVRGMTEEKAELTLSLLWLFRKQSFSVSGGMRELINDLISEMHNSNKIPVQMTLEGEPLYYFELLEVVTLEYLAEKRKPPPNAGEKWSFTVLDGRR